MNLDKYDNLMSRAEKGELTTGELEEVAAKLRVHDAGEDPYMLLHILGKGSTDGKYSNVVEPFLAGPDGFVAGKALQVLYWDWDLGDLYTTEFLKFMRGVSWDDSWDARSIAVSIAGDYLRSHSDPTLLRELIRIFTNLGGKKSFRCRSLRLIAYGSLVNAMGGDLHQVPMFPDFPEEFDFNASVNPAVIRGARERLAREEGSASSK